MQRRSGIYRIHVRELMGVLSVWLVLVAAATVIGTPSARAQTYSVLYSFKGPPDGGSPSAGLIRDSAGNLFGTTYYGGTAKLGVVYKLDSTGKETVLYSFTGGADGANPFASVILDPAGNLYGTTEFGGITGGGCGNAGCGVVFKLDSTSAETVITPFPAGGTSGKHPVAGVIQDSAGNLYGTTDVGGACHLPYGCGMVFKLGSTGTETVLHSFKGGADGTFPQSGLIRQSESLYGTTFFGGTAGYGVVYKLDATGHETVLYNFTGGVDGASPYGGVIRDSAGDLYGTTYYGGTANQGVVYKLDATGKETVLYNFTGRADGGSPSADVIRDSAGNLYGTTYYGGTAGYGVVYKLDATGDETVLYSFTGGADGGHPSAGVIRDSAGNLYGTTLFGGITGCDGLSCGVVFKLTP